jgi:hypothetical protein
MNPVDPQDRLLHALLAESNALDAMHSAALSELRRRRWRRTARLVTTAAAAVLIVFAAMRVRRDDDDRHPPGAAIAEVTPPPTATFELTDDELLNQFPPGTCTIAEIDGRKMLVFLTAEAKAKYLR